MSYVKKNIDRQTLKFDEVVWDNLEYFGNPAYIEHVRNTGGTTSNLQELANILDDTTDVTSAPEGLDSYDAMEGDNGRKPYWTFSYRIDSDKGLLITNVNVKDTLSSGSTEEVFEKIEFSDFKVFFNDVSHLLDLGTLLSTSEPETHIRFTLGENGSSRGDDLYQRGLKIEIITNVLAPSGGRCNVKLDLSVVFRGPKNDFDPGGVPVALLIWPQYSFKWDNTTDTTKRVEKFRGSIKMSLYNKMHHSQDIEGMQDDENVSSFFTDSNTALTSDLLSRPRMTSRFRAVYYSGRKADISVALGVPYGWANIFDYINLNLQNEFEVDGVYGPGDGNKYQSSREQRYKWIDGLTSPGIRVRKANRQGMYDNIHVHANMGNDAKGNTQVHAPFCGHSCIHLHWRWSNISSEGAIFGIGSKSKYRGWGSRTSHSLPDAPLVPPNQKVKVALCRFDANSSIGGNSFSDNNILDPSSLNSLDPLRKMVWYRTEILNPDAGEKQVAMEHGLGWAYRYSTTRESAAVRLLIQALSHETDQDVIRQKFRDDIYPDFRYKGSDNQIPEGDNDILYSSGNSGTSMEDL